MTKKLPPDPLPALKDPFFEDGEGIYQYSPLRVATGTKINPDSFSYYQHREVLTMEGFPAKTIVLPEIETWLTDTMGFDPRSIVKQTPKQEMPLSAVIPQVIPRNNGSFLFPLEEGTYLVNAMNIQPNPMTYPERIIGIKNHLPEGSKLYLAWFGDHDYIETLWTRMDFWDLEFLKEFDGILLPAFSAFSDDPIVQNIIAERQQQIFAQEGFEAGFNVIPVIAWGHLESFRRQVDFWTSLYPHVHTIAFDCLGHTVNRRLWTWRWLFAIEKYLIGLDHIRFIFSGLVSGWAIKELNRMFPNTNYHLIGSRHEYIRASSGTSNKEAQSRALRKYIARLEDFRSGREIAETNPRPDQWPFYADAKR